MENFSSTKTMVDSPQHDLPGTFWPEDTHLALVIILFHIIAFTYWYVSYNFYKSILMTIHHLCKNIFLTLSEQKMVI